MKKQKKFKIQRKDHGKEELKNEEREIFHTSRNRLSERNQEMDYYEGIDHFVLVIRIYSQDSCALVAN